MHGHVWPSSQSRYIRNAWRSFSERVMNHHVCDRDRCDVTSCVLSHDWLTCVEIMCVGLNPFVTMSFEFLFAGDSCRHNSPTDQWEYSFKLSLSTTTGTMCCTQHFCEMFHDACESDHLSLHICSFDSSSASPFKTLSCARTRSVDLSMFIFQWQNTERQSAISCVFFLLLVGRCCSLFSPRLFIVHISRE